MTEGKRQIIKDVMNYRSGEGMVNVFYVGSMMTARVVNLLGGRYGVHSVENLLETASDTQIDATYEALEHYIQYMQAHPVKHCECCGKIVPRT